MASAYDFKTEMDNSVVIVGGGGGGWMEVEESIEGINDDGKIKIIKNNPTV